MSYRPRLEALEGRALLSATPTLAWIPNDAQFPSQYALNSTGKNGGALDADIDAPEAWGTTVTARVPVAVVDTGIDYTHPDLYLNVWLNQAEIPAAIRSRLLDTDGNRLITFRDLNDARNQGTGKITDLNQNGYIDGGDVLRPIAQGGWADGVSNNGDQYVDDLIGWNFVTNTNDPFDDHGHGTHVSGIIGAVGNNGIGVAGVAWNAQLMALKAFDAKGVGDARWAVAAVDYATNLGAKVVNASWVIGGSSPTLAAAIERARLKDVVVVAAAGNSGANLDVTAAYPANSPAANVITVGAVDAAGNLATYSNYGVTTVDITAPGSNILSTNPGKSYGYRTGTSMAAPFVSGAVALVWGLRPEWTYRQVMDQVLNTVDRLPALSGKVASGGRLNLAAALKVPPRGTAPAVFVPTQTVAAKGAPQTRAMTATVASVLPVDAFLASRRGRRWLRFGGGFSEARP